MNEATIQHIASRARGLGKELLAIANELDRIAPPLTMQVQAPDLFTQMGLTSDDTMAQVGSLCDIHANPGAFEGLKADPNKANVLGSPQSLGIHPARRHYQRNGRRMTEALMVDTPTKVGKKQGYCNRNDIERSLVRITGRSREDVREAVNRIAERMQITCVKSRSYRYYPRSLRAKIINDATQELERI